MKKDKNIIQNTVLILKALSEFQSATQIKLKEVVRLRRTSIFNIFKLLQKCGLVCQSDTVIPPKGRPSIVWELKGNVGIFMVVYSSISYNYYALYDFSGKLISVSKETPSGSLNEVVGDLKRHIENIRDGKLCGVMVALSGAFNSQKDRVIMSTFWKVRNYPLIERLISELNLRNKPFIMIENNAYLAAWGEKVAGICKNVDNFIALYIVEGDHDKRNIGLGLGSGMIFNNKFFPESCGFTGELDGFFYRWLREHYSSDFPLSLHEIRKKHLKEFASDFGEKFSYIVNYLAPQKIVFLSEGKNPPRNFIDAFTESINKNLIIAQRDNFSVEMSSLGVNAILHGGAHILRRNFFSPSPNMIDMIKMKLPEYMFD